MSTLGRLTVLPSFPVWVHPDGRVTIGRKFLDGMVAYQQRWPGPITVALPSGPPTHGLDDETLDPATLGFRLVVDGDLRALIAESAVVLGAAGREQAHVAALCAAAGVPCVYVTEYSLKTRLQIVAANTRNPLLRARRAFWEWRTERIMRRALARSAGAQCNGTPTYAAYKDVTPSSMLFFDTRSAAAAMATDAELETRLAALQRGGPLRLAFSGRLVAMKGADHLLEVARALTARGFDYQLTICGDGDLADAMKAQIGALPVRMAGVLDFETELQPLAQGLLRPVRLLSPAGRPVLHLPGYDGGRRADRQLRQRGVRRHRRGLRSRRLGGPDEPTRPDGRAHRGAGPGTHRAGLAGGTRIRTPAHGSSRSSEQRIDHLKRLAGPPH